ncbi:transposase [Clostridium sp. YIM B02505]|uniref:Mutator family transposase n=1 Tax=Clostridium yunnanense TaxID=2800325 RepID=A0ABS1EPK1_9CLOT|nr:transposase [Clostridium yunnanense]
MDGLKGLPDAIKAIFHDVNIQTCIVHQIRNSIKYVTSKDSIQFISDLKLIYKSVTKEATLVALKDLQNTWENKYQIVINP